MAIEKTENTSKSWLDRLSKAFKEGPDNIADFVQIVEYVAKNKLITPDIKDMLKGVLDLSKLRVEDIMIPRSQMVTINKNSSFSEILPKIIESAHSRFPVIREDKDHIEGILHAKNLLSRKNDASKIELDKILRPAIVVNETKKVSELLKEFRAKRYHMGIVVDKYGSVTGLITIEDILELIVGDIEDEFDEKEVEKEDIKIKSENNYLIDALTPISDFNKFFNKNIDENEFDTFAGFIMHSFGFLPKTNDEIQIENMKIKVINADNRRVKELSITLLKTTNSKESIE